MSNSSLIAVSLEPAYFHHCRSKAMISRSRSESPVVGATVLSCSEAALTCFLDPSSVTVLSAHSNRRMTRVSFDAAGRFSVSRRPPSAGRWLTRHTSPTHPRATSVDGMAGQPMVSRMAVMSSSLVSGLTIAKRASVSPSWVVGTTNANSSASIRSDHAW